MPPSTALLNADSALPNELLATVFEFMLESEPKWHTYSLRSCSMVSRKWRILTRKYLFSKIRILESSKPSISAFTSLLASSPHLSACVHVLTLTGSSEWYMVRPASGSEYPLLELSVLASLISSLPNLQDLRLRFWQLPAFSSVQETSKSLRRLELSSLYSTGPIAHCGVGMILSLFSSVATLEIFDLSTDGTEPPSEEYCSEYGRTSAVQTLNVTVSADSPSTMLPPIFDLFGIFSTATALYLTPTSTGAVGGAAALIPSNSPRLRTVTVDVASHWSDLVRDVPGGTPEAGIEVLRVKLAGCSALHRFTLFFDSTPWTAAYASRMLLSLLDSFPPSVRHLTILVDCGKRSGITFRELPWAELIAFCKRPAGLISLDVVIRELFLGSGVCFTDDPALGEQLQGLQEEGVLHAHRVEEWDERKCGPECL